MSVAESSTAQALLILEALARVLESADGHMGREYAVMHAGYARAAAEAVMRDTGTTAEERKVSEAWGLDEWVGSLVTILYPSEQVEDRYAQVRG